MQSARSGLIGATGRTGTSGRSKRLSERAKRRDKTAKSASASETPFRESFSARFSEMVLINFEADERLLKKIIPPGLQPDLHQGAAHLSLVAKTIGNLQCNGFQLARPRPFSSVGLQLYVKEPWQGGFRYGTIFLKHYVQRSFPAWMMSRLTKCSISKMPIKVKTNGAPSNRPPDIEYHWKVGDKSNQIRIRGRSRIKDKDIREGSKIEFIFRHPDRYVVNDQGVWRSELQTPGWVVWDVAQAKFDCDVKSLFGDEFVKSMSRRPASVFLSRGNEVKLSKPELVVPANS